MAEYISILLSYFKDVIFSEYLRQLNIEYDGESTFKFDIDDTSKQLYALDEKFQDEILAKAEIFTDHCVKSLETFLISNNIINPELYCSKSKEINDFIANLIKNKEEFIK